MAARRTSRPSPTGNFLNALVAPRRSGLCRRRTAPRAAGTRGLRRILHGEQDAEDAFQATFLVLAKKATSVRWRDRVGAWLYDVASRVARRVRTDRSRRLVDQRQAKMAPSPDAQCLAAGRNSKRFSTRNYGGCRKNIACRSSSAAWKRQPVPGRTAVGWQEGTVAGRLGPARELLQRRLTHRGVTLSAAARDGEFTKNLPPPRCKPPVCRHGRCRGTLGRRGHDRRVSVATSS